MPKNINDTQLQLILTMSILFYFQPRDILNNIK